MGSCFSNEHSPSLPKPAAISHQILFNGQFDQDSSVLVNSYINKMHEITTGEEFNKLITDTRTTNVLLVCDFYASWCQPCLQCAPTLNKWALNDYKTKVIFMKIDVDQNSDLSNQFSIRFLPTFVLFKQGKEILRLTGADLTRLKREIDRLK